jgi:hypothetical protein
MKFKTSDRRNALKLEIWSNLQTNNINTVQDAKRFLRKSEYFIKLEYAHEKRDYTIVRKAIFESIENWNKGIFNQS